jgi:glycosyltransferase involved in cell wall biosynthesis
MPTTLVDLDLDQPLPAFFPPAGTTVTVTIWRQGVPLGIAHLDRTVKKSQLRKALLAQLGPIDDEQTTPPSVAIGSAEPLTVIVCTCRRPQLLAACLDGLLAQSHPADEILVIDNAPQEDASRLLLQSSYPSCRYFAEPRPGIRFARNRGLQEAKGEILAFIDDDCLPLPGWLAAIAGQFAVRPLLGCCTGPVLPLELATPAQEWLEARGGFARGFRRRLFAPTAEGLGPAYPLQAWMFGSGANMAFRRSSLQQIGPFAETLPTAEDLEIFYRIVRGGFELLYEPAAVVRHRHPPTLDDLRRRLFDWGWGYLAFLTQVACTDPPFRRRAVMEMFSWLRYQLVQRLGGTLFGRGGPHLPLHLILIEIAGGLVAVPAYLIHRARP